MMVTVALPQGWSQFARDVVGADRLRATVARFLKGLIQLPPDPGLGPEVFQFYLPEEVRDSFGRNRQLPEVVIRRALAAFVLAAQRQAASQQAPSAHNTQDDSFWSPARAALFLKSVLFIGVGAGTWMLMRSGTVGPDLPRSEQEEPNTDDYSTWEPEP